MSTTHIIVLPRPGQLELAQGSILFIGNATILLRYAGFSILTDPNFLHMGETAHLGYGLRSKRITNPALELKEVPPYDFVLLSHMHEDHFDRTVERKLPKGTMIITTQQATKKLKDKGFYLAQPLATWETLIFSKGEHTLRVTAMPGKHGPGIAAKLLPEVMGSLLEFQDAREKTLYRIYISGDTLMHKDLQEIPNRFPDIDLGLFHLGGTKALGLLLTMDAKQGIKAIQTVKPREAIPIHYEEYTVMKSPLSDFQELARHEKISSGIRYIRHGEEYQFSVPRERL